MSKPLKPIQVAVVGHTNTGKTSLLRTLMRDVSFGEVSARPSTTRHVELARLDIDGEPLVEFYDTPGMEDAVSLLSILDQIQRESASLDKRAVIEQFLESDSARGLFEQEAKVLRQLLLSDVALYVVDARDPVLAKHRDELAILARCAVPILPLLNFVAEKDANEQAWRDALARLGLHVWVSFDTVAPAVGAEQVLYTKLAALMEPFSQVFDRLSEGQQRQAQKRREAAMQLLAELLLDVAAYPLRIGAQEALEPAAKKLHEKVRAREQRCVTTLLNLYGFRDDDLLASELPFSAGRWEEDLFDPATLSAMGINVGGGAAAGAVAGLGVDLMLGGTTLGGAAAIGALMGGGVQTLRHYGRQLGSRFGSLITGTQKLRVSDEVLQLLLARQVLLIQALELRGHAALHKIELNVKDGARVWQGELKSLLNLARENAHWSGLDRIADWNDQRQAVVDQIANCIVLGMNKETQAQ